MMGLTDFNLTPKAKKGLKDAQKFAQANELRRGKVAGMRM